VCTLDVIAADEKIKPNVATKGRASPSVARSLSVLEQRDLAAIARALPLTWCVVVEPPSGQLSIGPLSGRRRYHRAWVASLAAGRIVHDSALL